MHLLLCLSLPPPLKDMLLPFGACTERKVKEMRDNPVPAAPMNEPVITSQKRKKSFWDCIFTGQNLALTPHGWDFTNNKGPDQLLFTSKDLQDYINNKSLRRFNCKSVKFKNCDFN